VPILIGNEVGDLAITNLDGTSVSVIAESNGFINNPSWAPDGSRIVFETINTIYSILTNGGAQTRLAQGISPAYSPDGQKIVFVAGAPGSYDLYLMNADGSNPAILTNAPGDDYDPAWSPDGGAIVFTSNRDGNPEIYVISLDGSGLVRLTNNPADDRQPNWAP
jgi:Tol biopolymer transport system component